MRYLTALFILTLAACDDGDTASPAPIDPRSEPTSVEVQTTIFEKATDVLLVIDNSGSMCQEQDALGQQIAALATYLTEVNADVRVAVVTTDMQDEDQSGAFRTTATAPEARQNCRALDGEPLVPNTADCPPQLPAVFRPGPDAEANALHLRCVINQGTEGDGFEAGLEAMRVGLSCDGPNRDAFAACCTDDGFDPRCTAAVDFLRPAAQLIVAIISDENDCSAPALNPGASKRPICKLDGEVDNDGDGYPDVFVDDPVCEGMSIEECYASVCGALDPDACRMERCVMSRRDNSNCSWFRDTLVPIDDYRDFLAGLKPEGLMQVSVLPLVGPEAFTPDGFPIRFSPGPERPECESVFDDRCCPGGQCRTGVDISCEGQNGAAFSGFRYHALAHAVDGACGPGVESAPACPSICQGEYSGFVDRITGTIDGFGDAQCLDRPPKCQLEDARPCTDLEALDPRNRPFDAQLQCADCEDAPDTLTDDDVSLEFDRTCDSGYRVRYSDALPRGATLVLRYEADSAR